MTKICFQMRRLQYLRFKQKFPSEKKWCQTSWKFKGLVKAENKRVKFRSIVICFIFINKIADMLFHMSHIPRWKLCVFLWLGLMRIQDVSIKMKHITMNL